MTTYYVDGDLNYELRITNYEWGGRRNYELRITNYELRMGRWAR